MDRRLGGLIGFGKDYPRNPHHRDSALKLKDSGNWDLFKSSSAEYTNPNLLVGALVGGPGADDSYEDLREDYQVQPVLPVLSSWSGIAPSSVNTNRWP